MKRPHGRSVYTAFAVIVPVLGGLGLIYLCVAGRMDPIWALAAVTAIGTALVALLT